MARTALSYGRTIEDRAELARLIELAGEITTVEVPEISLRLTELLTLCDLPIRPGGFEWAVKKVRRCLRRSERLLVIAEKKLAPGARVRCDRETWQDRTGEIVRIEPDGRVKVRFARRSGHNFEPEHLHRAE